MKRNNKIALCISGQPRNVEAAYRDNIKKYLIEPNNITDVFVHTWWDWEWAFGKNLPDYENRNHPTGIDATAIMDIKYLYKPLLMRVEDQRTYQEFIDEYYFMDPHFQGRERWNIKNAFYKYLSVYKANELKKEFEREVLGHEYDVVVKMRFDARFEKPILIEELDLDYVHVPTMAIRDADVARLNRIYKWDDEPYDIEKDWRVKNDEDVRFIRHKLNPLLGIPYKNFLPGEWHHLAINDTFAIGTSQNMNTYCSVINHLKWMGKKHPTAVAEGTMGRWMKENDIKIYASWIDQKEIGIHRQKYSNARTVALPSSYKEEERELPVRETLGSNRGPHDIDGKAYIKGIAKLK